MRWYRRGVRSLHVHIRAAAGALGQDLPPVEVAGDSLEELRGRVQLVVREVETVVLRLQQSEREVLRAEQLAAVGQLAAGMAHEIRNPLTAIKMLVDTQREEAMSRGIPVEDYDLIRDELKRVERSLDSFLNFARLPRPEKTRQDLSRLVRQTISLLQGRAQQQKVKLEFHPPTVPISVDADGGQIVQVLVNLALNALDAMPAGGTLSVELKAPAPDAVEVDLLDTGPGIAPEMLPRLFEPFASNKEAGLGLGLVTSRRIIEDHGGRLLATNRPGGGACFTVHLPAA
jgi:two-component system sensor histidine kinase HydH